MVTYAQAQELAEDWINAGVPRSKQREVRVREFDLGFVCWAVGGSGSAASPGSSGEAEGAPTDGGEARMVIARDSGASTLWPPLPVNEVVRQYEETYGGPVVPNPAGAAKPVVGAVEATSFLLTPPQWVQDAGAAAIAAEAAKAAAPAAPEAPVVFTAAPVSDRPAAGAPTMLAPPAGGPAAGPTPPAGVPTPSGGVSLAHNAVPPLASLPPLVPGPVPPEGATVPLPEGILAGQPPMDFAAAPPPPPGALPVPLPPPVLPGTPGPGTPPPAAPDSSAAQGISYAPTMLATDGVPGLQGLPGAPGMPDPHAGAGGLGRSGPGAPPPPPPADLLGPAGGQGVHGAAGRSGPGAPPPPPPADLLGGMPAAPGPDSAAAGVAYQATQLAHAIELPPGVPGLSPPPPIGAAPAPVAPAPGMPVPGMPPVGYGYPGAGAAAAGAPAPAAPPLPAPVPAPAPPVAPGPPGLPSVGPGSVAVVSYRGPDGSEQKLIHRSEPGTPHPEWKVLQELRRLNVPPDQVLELHTDLECCDLPGGYCARMVRASWPNVRLSHTAPYGRDQQARQAGMALLLDHLDQLHQLAAGPQRPRPVRVPLPGPGMVPPLPPIAPQQLAAELGQVFGPGVFRFEQRAVSRQGVPEPVAQTLMWAGLPRDFAPFFWAQAQEGRPIPTLAELAAERGLQPGPDFGGYLVLGNDYGRQLCVQYGTAAVVAVDMEGGGEQPRFVNSGVPEFVRSLALLGRMWRLRYGLTPDQAGRWTTDFQAQLAAIDPAALQTTETWWAVLLEQFWDGLL